MQQPNHLRDNRFINALWELLSELRKNQGKQLYSVCGKQEHFLCEKCYEKKENKCVFCNESSKDKVPRRRFQNFTNIQLKETKQKLQSILWEYTESLFINYSDKNDKIYEEIKQLRQPEQSKDKCYKPGIHNINLNDYDIASQQSLLKLTQKIVNQEYQNQYLESIGQPLFLAIDIISSLILVITIFLQIYFICLHSLAIIRIENQNTLVSLYGSLLWFVFFIMNFMDGFWMGKRSCNRFYRFYETLSNRFFFISILPVNILAIFFALPLLTIQKHLKLKHKIPWLFPFNENPGPMGYSLIIIPNCVYLTYTYYFGANTMDQRDDDSYILMPVIFFSLLIVPTVIFMDYRLHQIDVGYKEKDRQEKDDFIIENDRMFLKIFRGEKVNIAHINNMEDFRLQTRNNSRNNLIKGISMDHMLNQH